VVAAHCELQSGALRLLARIDRASPRVCVTSVASMAHSYRPQGTIADAFSPVSWSWGSGQPGGTVAEVKEQGEIAIESNRGNTIKKNASPENPAVHIERPGNDVVKRASELQIDEKADGGDAKQANGDKKEEDKQAEPEKTEEKSAESEKKEDKAAEAEKKDDEMEDAQTSGESKTEESKDKATADATDDKPSENTRTTDEDKTDAPETGSKRKADDSPAKETNGSDDKPAEKKTKTEADKPAGKKGGRPKKEKKEPTKKKQPKKAATSDGQPRRSGRNAGKTESYAEDA
jgi:hypothetical protein